ncbi:MAG: hypothetical protein ACYS0D_16080 [Planctomycetota bacterium]|jgi:hypothetical protein
MSDKPLKSAYELAMERLEAGDREAGIEDTKPLTDEQKKTIAELRQRAKAKLAEIEILHRKDIAAAAADPEQLTKLEEQYETDRGRVESSLESAVARVRRGEKPGELD